MRVLIVIPGTSGPDLHVLHVGAWLADRLGTAPTVLRVVSRPSERSSREDALDEALATCGIRERVAAKVRCGDAHGETMAEAREGNYGILVAGDATRRWWDVRGRAAGAVRLVERAPCHVLIVKGSGDPRGRFLLCDSGMRRSSLVERFARQLSALVAPDDRITVLHVMSQIGAAPGVADKDLRAAAADLMEERAPEGAMLERDVALLAPLGVRAEPKVRHGMVVEEILSEARDGDYGVVVIGAFQSTGWRRVLLNDLARQVIGQIDRPLLVVR